MSAALKHCKVYLIVFVVCRTKNFVIFLIAVNESRILYRSEVAKFSVRREVDQRQEERESEAAVIPLVVGSERNGENFV